MQNAKFANLVDTQLLNVADNVTLDYCFAVELITLCFNFPLED